jgi:hypothetical protein
MLGQTVSALMMMAGMRSAIEHIVTENSLIDIENQECFALQFGQPWLLLSFNRLLDHIQSFN